MHIYIYIYIICIYTYTAAFESLRAWPRAEDSFITGSISTCYGKSKENRQHVVCERACTWHRIYVHKYIYIYNV